MYTAGGDRTFIVGLDRYMEKVIEDNKVLIAVDLVVLFACVIVASWSDRKIVKVISVLVFVATYLISFKFLR
jgi:hypothetical protein